MRFVDLISTCLISDSIKIGFSSCNARWQRRSVVGLVAGMLCMGGVPQNFAQADEPAVDHTPRVYLADGGDVLGRLADGVIALSKQWPAGSFGIDSGTYLFNDSPQTIARMKAGGITTFITEGFVTLPYTRLEKSFFLTDIRGNISTLYPYHGEDPTQPEVLAVTKKYIAQAAREGFSEYILIDYVWPWDGRYGYGPKTVAAYREYLNGNDDGMVLEDGRGGQVTIKFWDYLKLYTDVTFRPAEMGIANWSAYTPVAENYNSKNYFLFNALCHYAHLQFLQKCGEYALSQGIIVSPTLNPEDINNCCDIYVMSRLRGVGKIGYEYFGNPAGTTAWYHSMRTISANLHKYGHQMACVGEINAGGHGPTRYAWDVAYAHYYDMTCSTKPIDYNNQYMEADWSAVAKTDGQFPRYAHWAGGALGFMQSHAENRRLPAPKETLLVNSRAVLERSASSQVDFIAGSFAGLLDLMHYPFDASGKEEFETPAKNARVLVYVPAESSPMHHKKVMDWLKSSPDHVLVTYADAPFKTSIGTVQSNAPLARSGLSLNLKNVETRIISLGGSNVTCQIFHLQNGTPMLRSTEGVPLITAVQWGANKIIYINAAVTIGAGAVEQEIVRQTLALAGVTPEASVKSSAEADIRTHLYDIPGGKSVVLWNLITLWEQGRKNYYVRVATNPSEVTLPIQPGVSYTLYDFYADKLTTLTAPADGKLRYVMAHSLDILYFGKSDDASFTQALESVRATRQKLAKLEPPAASN